LRSNEVVFILNAKPALHWQILNKNISQKFSLSVLVLDLKFCKNLGFSQVSIVKGLPESHDYFF
jgi:hypothetical protein